MEPKAVSRPGDAGCVVSRRSINPEEFLNLGSPTIGTAKMVTPTLGRQVEFAPSPQQPTTPATPQAAMENVASSYNTPPGAEPSCFDSPSTPYFLHPQHLIQQTCPPRQTQQALFPATDSNGGRANNNLKQRLLLARRKSLQFVPKVGSPLAKMFG